MLPRKIACNATNSASIDHEGTVWVWGAARHRLLGAPQDNNQSYPRPLSLEIHARSEEERKMRDAFLKKDEVVRIRCKEIAMGANHMLAVGNDALGSGEEEMEIFDYAEHIFIQVKQYLIEAGKDLLKENEDVRNFTERELIEKKMKHYFKADKRTWPYARWFRFIDLLFEQVKIVFQTDTEEIISRLQ